MASAQLKNSFYSIGEVEADMHPSTLTLKLSLTNKVCRYFVVSHTNKQIIFFGEYTMHHVSTEAEILQRFERIIDKDEILQLPFSKILIGLDGSYRLIPAALTEQMIAENNVIQHCNEVDIVFHVEAEMNNTLRRLFAGPKLCHLNSALLNVQAYKQSHLIVNIQAAHFDVVWRNNSGNLILMNRYTYSAATDFIYYLLLCCNELQINRETETLILLGEIEKPSKIYDLCYRYFKQIEFAAVPTGIRFSDAFDQFPKHLHYALYNLQA